MTAQSLSQERLKELLHYCPDSGIFTWLSATNKNKEWRIGMNAGNLDNGYIWIKINSVKYPASRLAFLYVTGSFPEFEVDHKDHTRNNNKWDNLRHVTRADNSKNQTIHRNNTSGFNGINWRKNRNRWLVRIAVNGKRIYIGMFVNIKDAVEARKQANITYNFHENHGANK